MTLALIERFSGRDLSKRVAEILTYRPTEHAGPQQKLLSETSLVRMDRTLGLAVDLMLAHLSEPLSIATVSEQTGVPQWTLVRLFKRHLKQTPSAYYLYLRLSQARNLLLNSTYRISEIGGLCGFDTPESFSRAYKRHFGETASQTKASSASASNPEH